MIKLRLLKKLNDWLKAIETKKLESWEETLGFWIPSSEP